MVRKTKLAYFAGFFDGEGSVSIKRQINNGRKEWSPTHLIEVQMGNVKVEPLWQMRHFFRGSIQMHHTTKGTNHCKWTVTSRNAAAFLTAIYPYVIIKKEQIKLALEFEKKCVRKEYPHRVRTPKKLIEKRDRYRERMIEINKSRVTI